MKKVTLASLMLTMTSLFAEGEAAAEAAKPGFQQFLLPLIILGIFYFLVIRPETTKAKNQKALLETLSKGDEVYTNSGILGTIVGMTEKVVTLEVSENTKLKVLRSQVAGLSSKLFEKKEEKK